MVHISMMRLKFCYIPTNKVILGVGCMMLAHIYTHDACTHDACTHDACTHDAYTHDACMHESMMLVCMKAWCMNALCIFHVCMMHICRTRRLHSQNAENWGVSVKWPNKAWITLFCYEIRFVLIHTLLDVNFSLQKSCLCKTKTNMRMPRRELH